MARRKSAAPWALIAGGAAGEAALQRRLPDQAKRDAPRKQREAEQQQAARRKGRALPSRYDPGMQPVFSDGFQVTRTSSRPDRCSY